MSRFRDEMQLIQWPARLIAVIMWVALFCVMYLQPFTQDPKLRNWPLAAKLVVAALPGLPLFVLVLMIGYVYSDAKRRGMRYVMWTLLAIFIPNAIGLILYFILRDPLLVACSRCGTGVKAGFAFCPNCGGAMGNACSQCRCAVQPGWSHCVSCGAALPQER